jgi:hypothetical protein
MTHVAFALLFSWAAVAIGAAQTPAEAAAQLGARISSQLQRRPTVSLELQNLSAMTPADLSSFRNALNEELRKAGLAMTTTQPETRVHVTVSENTRGLLLVAEMLSGGNRSIIMQPWIAPPLRETKPRLKMSLKSIWTQPEPVLDLLLLNSESEMVVLSPTAVSSFQIMGGKWMPTGIAGLPLTRPPVRDPRGRIENAPGGFLVYLPGTTCRGALQPLRLECAAGNEAWPINPRDPSIVARWVTDRNVLESPSFQNAFYAGAKGWFSTAEHRIIDRSGNSLALPEAWGSDFGSIESSCGPNPTVLASGSSDNPDRDQARVYEITSGHATPVSDVANLPGPITALWPAEPPGQATVVVRDSKTGNYEASRLGVACAE